MLSQSNIFLGVLLLIVAAQGVEYIEDVIARARENAASYESGKDIKKPLFWADGIVMNVGALNNESVRLLSDEVKLAIAACFKILDEKKNVEETLIKLTTVAVLIPDSGRSVNTDDLFISGNMFKDSLVKDLKYKIFKVTENLELLAATHILGDSSIDISKVGMKMLTMLRKSCNGKTERDLINLAVLNLPQQNSREIIVDHIEATVRVNCDNSDGIHLEYKTRKFTPRDDVISAINEDVKKKAIAKLEKLFDEMEPREMPPHLTPPTPSKGSSEKPSTALMSIAAALTTAITIMKRNGDEDEDEDDDVCE